MIIDMLNAHNKKEKASFHMPGHKGKSVFAGRSFAKALFPYDTTELCDTDALIAPAGEILEAEKRAACLYGAKHSFYLVNGASCGILAMIYAAFSPGDVVLVDRNCHQSVIHAAELTGILPVCLTPEPSCLPDIPGTVSVGTVNEALLRFPEAKGLIITSPNYYGSAANLKAIAELIHNAGGVLLVDEAHGAHFPFSPVFPQTAMAQGADMSVTSLHKTLPSPNQTALLHIGHKKDLEKVRQCVRMFQTSSPSYVLLAAMEQAIEYAAREGKKLTEQLLAQLTPLACPTLDDPFKLLPDFRSKGLSGREIDAIFREKFGIYSEMTTAHGLLLMVSFANSKKNIKRLSAALRYLRALPEKSISAPQTMVMPQKIMQTVLQPAAIKNKTHKTASINDSLGQICARSITAFPPCIPLLLPGEMITAEHIELLLALQAEHAVMTGLDGDKITICY